MTPPRSRSPVKRTPTSRSSLPNKRYEKNQRPMKPRPRSDTHTRREAEDWKRDHSSQPPRDLVYINLARLKNTVETIRTNEIKDTNRCKLFVTHVPKVLNDEFKELFNTFGEATFPFFKPDSFAFVQYTSETQAENAMEQVNNLLHQGRNLGVTFAKVHSILVKNLPLSASNELVQMGFSIFGDIEKCYVRTDRDNHSLLEAVVEYRGVNAMERAIHYCNRESYYLAETKKPVIVEPYFENYHCRGIPESMIPRDEKYFEERSCGPHFAKRDTFKHQNAQLYKEVYKAYNDKVAAAKRERDFEEEKIAANIQRVRLEMETGRLRELLHQAEQAQQSLSSEFQNKYAGVSSYCSPTDKVSNFVFVNVKDDGNHLQGNEEIL